MLTKIQAKIERGVASVKGFAKHHKYRRMGLKMYHERRMVR